MNSASPDSAPGEPVHVFGEHKAFAAFAVPPRSTARNQVLAVTNNRERRVDMKDKKIEKFETVKTNTATTVVF